ncbi:hypothetical protein D3C85_1838800 [compost metagenome]
MIRPVTNNGIDRPALNVPASLARYAASIAIGGTMCTAPPSEAEVPATMCT